MYTQQNPVTVLHDANEAEIAYVRLLISLMRKPVRFCLFFAFLVVIYIQIAGLDAGCETHPMRCYKCK